jgi:hypothetical protein
MNSTETIGTIASQLHDGGWRPEDRDRLKSYYELTDSEADEIIAMMEGME